MRMKIHPVTWAIVAVVTFVVPRSSAVHAAEKSLAGVSSAEDVDRALSADFVRRHPGMDTPPLAAAWKQLVMDATRAPTRLIFDTDIGTDIDDVLALVFALRRPELEVCAITTSRGEVSQRAAIVSRLLQVLGRTDVPFAPGSPTRLDGSTLRDKPVDQFPFAGSEADRPRAACAEAQELLRRVIVAHPGEVWLVIVGPMTNAAILIRDRPELARKLKGIVCMGGAPGHPYAETNIGNDAPAAALVCRSGLLKFAGTNDVTMRLLLPAGDIQRLEQANTPATRAMLELISLWRASAPGKPGPVLFDVCPLLWLIEPRLLPTTQIGLTVSEHGHTSLSSSAPPCAVSTDLELLTAHRLVMDTLAR